MEQQTKIESAIQEIEFKIKMAEIKYESVTTELNTLRVILDDLDKIKRNEKLK
jgi:archaellum component FlaC